MDKDLYKTSHYYDDENSQFLKDIYNAPFSEYVEFRAFRRDDAKSFFVGNFKQIPDEELKALNSQGYEICFGPVTRKTKCGKKHCVSEVPALWVDIDNNRNEDKASLRSQIDKRIEHVGLDPSYINGSGHGFHLYFILRDNFMIKSQEDKQMIEGNLRWLASVFGGDNVCDISRVMRLPGFQNMKDPNDPQLCSIVYQTNNRYNLSDFKQITNQESNMNKIELCELPNEIPSRFHELLESDNELNKTWLGQREDLSDSSGSGYDFALASKLVRRDFTNEEIAKILQESHAEKKTPRTIPYLEHTIGKARTSYDESRLILSNPTMEHNILADLSLKSYDFNECGVEYLIEDILPDKSIMLLTSKHGEGKSILALALAKRLITEGKNVIIIDADMSVNVIGERLDAAGLKSSLSYNFFYLHSTRFPMKINIEDGNWDNFKNHVGDGNYIIIFDNFKDLAPIGADIDRDKDVVPIMNELKKIRDMSNTVIMLHHVGKDVSNKNPYKNSGSIADAVDVAYRLERKNDEFMLKNFKNRLTREKNVKFTLEPDFTLRTKETEQEIMDSDNMIKIFEYMQGNYDGENGLLQKDIMEGMAGTLSKEKVRESLRNGENEYWKKTQGEKNSYIYVPNDINEQNSKNLPPYIRKKLGFLENMVEIKAA